MKKNCNKKIQKAFTISFLLTMCFSSLAQADKSQSAYGRQGTMSPASTTSLVLDGVSRDLGGSGTTNGVYLSAQPPFTGMSAPVLAPLNPSQMPPLQVNMSPYNTGGQQLGYQQQYPQPYQGGGNNYQNGMGYGNAYPQPQGYGQGYVPQPLNPYTIPYQAGTRSFGPNTYTTAPIQYGNPPDYLQRNSANYPSDNLPYRKGSQMSLNPDARNPSSSSMRMGPKPNQQVVDILSAQKPLEKESKVASTNWFQKMAQPKEAKPPRW